MFSQNYARVEEYDSMRRCLWIGILLAAAILLAACGGASGPVNLKVTAEDIKYSVTALSVQAGRQVNLTLENAGSLDHSFLIDELGVKIEKVQAGQSGSASFTPAAGTYTFYCDVPGHKEAGMTGTLTVNP